EIEICIICDGSPTEMVSFFQSMSEDDPRIRVFSYPKSKRTGEPYRDEVIKQMTGNAVCYCCHDDLWLPNHIETIEETLKEFDFTHTLHAAINTPENIKEPQDLFACIYWIDLKDQKIIEKMQNKENFFGLTYGAHTKESY
ncbi:MAG: glycosyltransferase family A protein, partial [Bacillota bacterium]